MDLQLSETINAAEKVHLMEWSDQVFPVEGRKYTWSEPSHHIIAYAAGKPVAHLGFGRYEIVNGDRRTQLIGVGGVVVRPEWQGNGIPQRLFEVLHSTPELDTRNSVCTLFCPTRLETYYKKHGYQKYGGVVHIPNGEQPKVFDFSFMYRGEAEFSPSISLVTNPW